ncbi:hypothetical protein [Salisaeta longa]|uniref:hypothetical protein n=1 Tax=Salisaeta longa TaxID=503170 RepID=UPI00058D7926|nr:hypothetical protein [Salisaeta longa]
MKNVRTPFAYLLGFLLGMACLAHLPHTIHAQQAPQVPATEAPTVVQSLHPSLVFTTLDRSEFLLTAPFFTSAAGRAGNSAQVRIDGRQNDLSLTQVGRFNAATIQLLQSDGNVVRARQQGRANELGLLIQNGGSNQLHLLQQGRGLELSLELQNVRGLKPRISQVGPRALPLYIKVEGP